MMINEILNCVERISWRIIAVLLMILLVIVVVLFPLFLVDTPTVRQIGTIKVRCVDDTGAEFIDELCERDMTCSWLGIAGHKRCKNVKE